MRIEEHRRAQALAMRIGFAMLAISATVAYAAGVTTIYRYDNNGNLIETVDVSSDVNNCGGIGTACPAGNACCLGQCSLLATDPANCGACGNACYVPVNGYATCSAPTCGVACNASYTKCGTQCVSTVSDPSNCGACGIACSGGTCCSGACKDLGSDLNNCGGCGVRCPAGPANSYPMCRSSQCSFSCNSGYALCSAACVDLATDASNCGACGHVCPSAPDPQGYPYCYAGICDWDCYPGTGPWYQKVCTTAGCWCEMFA